MRRLYFLIPDAEITGRIVNDLLLADIPERQVHIVAKDHELLQDGELPEAGLLQEPQVVPAIEKGLAAGGVAGLLAGLVAVTFPPAGLALGGGALLGATEQYENTLVRAPFAGIVVERHVELGEMATVGMPLMTGLSLEHLRVVVDVPQSDIGALRGGGEAWVELPDGDSLPAEQIRIFPYADPATHTFRVRMRLAAGQHGIYPGMWVKVSFHTGEDQVLPVPATAVITRSELTAVYVMGTDGAPRLRQVRLGRELPDGRVAVLAGLDPGERVVTDGDAARRALLDERR